MSSPWLHAVVAGMTALDVVFPVIPGETAVVTAGAAAATGPPHLLPVITAAALGAFAGGPSSTASAAAPAGSLRSLRLGFQVPDALLG